MKPILELQNINKSFSGIQVLFDVSLTVHRGEVVCLAGENGAGKSTLIKILSGAEYPDSGHIILQEKKYSRMHPFQAIKSGIATIYQDVDLVETLTVADNIFLNSEFKKYGVLIDKRRQEKQTKEFLKTLNIAIPPDAEVSSLSPGQKQNLQIAKALHRNAEILILDEPTASLGEEETKALIELIHKLKTEGKSIIYISHYLDEIFTVGDRVVILKDGHHVGTEKIADITTDILIRNMVGRDTAERYTRRGYYNTNDNALHINYFSDGNLVKDISLKLSHGEILGIGGMVGAGRTEFVRLLFGAGKRTAGEMILSGKNITPNSPKDAIEKGICFISEDRKHEGLFLIRSIKENIALIKNNDNAVFFNLNQEKKDVQKCIDELQIKVFGQQQEVGKLSGGNQQKTVISRWLLKSGDIYIFDEPSKGVDIGAREQIYQLMEMLAKNKKIIIMVSSNMTELMSLSDRIAVMREGRLCAAFESQDFDEQNLLKAYIGA
ncbi:sugar ABC transporter ATP-binding protein [Treponema sp. OMZ 840]